MRTSPIRRIPRFLVVRPWRALLVAVLALATLLPPAAVPPAVAAGRPGGPLVPADGVYVGAYTKHIDGYGKERAQSAMSDLEQRLGRRLHINHHFYAWADVFPSWREPWDIEHERIPMISWNGENTDAIARGDWDGMIAARAQAVAMLNTPVFIRWFWEMDGNKKQGYISSPPSYQKAWRHIHDIFEAAGATNAVWVWCPNASAIADGTAMKYYPGGTYVDWTCGDGYNFAPNRPGDKWETFAEVYNGFYTAATKLGKPIMIGEFGVLERNPGEKERWFRQAHDWVAQHPAIAALVYFNADSTTNGVYFDWRVDTSPSAFEGFRYLFTGPAASPPSPAPHSGVPTTVSDPVEMPAATPTTTAPKQSRPRVAAPATSTAPVVTDVPAAPATATASGGVRGPSHRLTWVLHLLRQLDAAAVAV
jgi:hypothetical protein